MNNICNIKILISVTNMYAHKAYLFAHSNTKKPDDQRKTVSSPPDRRAGPPNPSLLIPEIVRTARLNTTQNVITATVSDAW